MRSSRPASSSAAEMLSTPVSLSTIRPALRPVGDHSDSIVASNAAAEFVAASETRRPVSKRPGRSLSGSASNSPRRPCGRSNRATAVQAGLPAGADEGTFSTKGNLPGACYRDEAGGVCVRGYARLYSSSKSLPRSSASTISNAKRRLCFMLAAPRMVRRERAVRPCFPMTLPTSAGATSRRSTAVS